MIDAPDLAACHELAEVAPYCDWRPTVDPELHVLLLDCPLCHAQDTDPLGMYRPARAVPRGNTLTVLCRHCRKEWHGQLR